MDAHLLERIRAYAAAHETSLIEEKVGHGNDGDVWPTSRRSVIKVFFREPNYLRERDCYLRLASHGVTTVDGLTVPQLIGFDDSLQVIEITLVNPPYLLDFGKAYLDDEAPYTPEQLDEWRASMKRTFRKNDIPRILRILRLLRGYGIEYLDARPWNIRLRTDAEEDALPDEDWEEDFD